MCHHVLNMPKEVLANVGEEGPVALIMAPTRELAIQIDEEVSERASFEEDENASHC